MKKAIYLFTYFILFNSVFCGCATTLREKPKGMIIPSNTDSEIIEIDEECELMTVSEQEENKYFTEAELQGIKHYILFNGKIYPGTFSLRLFPERNGYYLLEPDRKIKGLSFPYMHAVPDAHGEFSGTRM